MYQLYVLVTNGIRISSNCVELIFVKVHLSTLGASRDAIFQLFFLPNISTRGSSSVTDVGLQGVFIYRHFFLPFSITSAVMSSVTSFPEEGEMKGVFLKIIPTPRHIPQVDIIAGTESLARYLPGHQGEQLRSEVQRCLSKAGVPSPNLTKRQTAATKELKVDSDTIILPADMGNATVLLKKEEYDGKVRELLDDTSYQPIKKEPNIENRTEGN